MQVEVWSASPTSSEVRRVRGMERAEQAMTVASLGAVPGLAGTETGDPPHRQSGQVGDLAAGVPATVSGRAPVEAGWSTTSRTVPNLALSLSEAARSFGSVFGSGLSKTVFPAGVRPCP
jgi:hypothetical protein